MMLPAIDKDVLTARKSASADISVFETLRHERRQSLETAGFLEDGESEILYILTAPDGALDESAEHVPWWDRFEHGDSTRLPGYEEQASKKYRPYSRGVKSQHSGSSREPYYAYLHDAGIAEVIVHGLPSRTRGAGLKLDYLTSMVEPYLGQIYDSFDEADLVNGGCYTAASFYNTDEIALRDEEDIQENPIHTPVATFGVPAAVAKTFTDSLKRAARDSL